MRNEGATEGLSGTGMPGFRKTFGKDQIRDLLAYVRALGK